VISWPTLNGKLVGTALRSSSWSSSSGVIADETRSGKPKVRANHIKTPDAFTIIMHMTLEEYRVFDNWWKNINRKGVYTFSYPKIDDNTGEQVEYQFVPNTGPGTKNTSALNVEVSMNWQEVI
jgi:hypothetical protein